MGGIKKRFPNIELHEYTVMPNHFHGILEIVENNETTKKEQPQGIAPTSSTVGTSLAGVQNNKKRKSDKGQPQGFAPTRIPPTVKIAPTVGNIIGAFKSITSVEYIRGIETKNWKQFDKRLWQRNYWEHIIRNDDSFDRISQYIKNNPRKWHKDKLK